MSYNAFVGEIAFLIEDVSVILNVHCRISWIMISISYYENRSSAIAES